MNQKDDFFYPVTKETIHKYAESIFRPITRGECVTTVWVPMAGRRMWNKFIIENIQLFKNELPHFNKYLLVYIEPLDLTEESLAGYIRLMAKSFLEACNKNKEVKDQLDKVGVKIFDDPNATYSSLLDNLRKLLKDITARGLNVVFFVGEFDELTFANKIFYNNLKSLWSGLYPRLHYVFLMRERVMRQKNISQWGELNEAILQNIVYVPIRSENDIDYLLGYYSKENEIKIDNEHSKLLKHLCGGHPYLLKASVRFIANHPEYSSKLEDLKNHLLNYYELQSVAQAILAVRSDKEKKVLNLIAAGKKPGSDMAESLEFLFNLGLVISDADGKFKLFGEMLEQVVLGQAEKGEAESITGEENLTLDKNTGAILLNSKTVEEMFTRQEYSVLSGFLKDKGKLLSRDEVGESLWGKESYEKYSDWAIDQLISKLRKKLKKLNAKSNIVTIRGRGYKVTG